MSLSAEGRFAGEENVIPVNVDVLEPLGEKMDIYAVTENHPHIVARVDARRDIKEDQQIELHLDMNKAYIFEPGDEGPNLGLA